ncbi:MAG: hypothetical protein J0M04_17635 [Verrucomicrobia bacterium]|nr:hypothetical protein [Verrucomicrobiota bacterium]
MESNVAGAPAGGVANVTPETHEEDLQALIDEQARRISSRRRLGNRLLLGFFALVLAGAGGAYGLVPGVRQQVNQLAADMKLVGRDIRMASSPEEMKKAYDKSLEKIGTRSTAVDDATRSLGVDPATVTDNDLSAEERKLMGNEGRTVSERNRMLQAKLGDMKRQMANTSTPPKSPSAPAPQPKPAAPATTTAAPVSHDEPLIIR